MEKSLRTISIVFAWAFCLAACDSVSAAEIQFNGEAISYTNYRELENKCLVRLAVYTKKIKSFDDSANDWKNPFRGKAKENAKNERAKLKSFLDTKICSSCHGFQKLTCYKCKGKGKNDDLFDWGDCNTCSGTGKYKCPDCDQNKKVTIKGVLEAEKMQLSQPAE